MSIRVMLMIIETVTWTRVIFHSDNFQFAKKYSSNLWCKYAKCFVNMSKCWFVSLTESDVIRQELFAITIVTWLRFNAHHCHKQFTRLKCETIGSDLCANLRRFYKMQTVQCVLDHCHCWAVDAKWHNTNRYANALFCRKTVSWFQLPFSEAIAKFMSWLVRLFVRFTLKCFKWIATNVK